MNLHLTLFITSLLLVLGFVPKVDAQSPPAMTSNEEAQWQQKAKMRLYPGGRDEEPLQVQASLPLMGRRLQPAQEPVEIPDETPEPAHND